jgi:hypothetical protein
LIPHSAIATSQGRWRSIRAPKKMRCRRTSDLKKRPAGQKEQSNSESTSFSFNKRTQMLTVAEYYILPFLCNSSSLFIVRRRNKS